MIKIDINFIKDLPEGFVLTDTNLYKQYPSLVKNRKNLYVIEAGEQSKSGENYLRIASKLEGKRIIAFGGGVVGDLAGFLAATFKRGINLVQVPTSLMAMVDSSIGGKNGINVGLKKNYLGTIYEAENVLIDLKFLKTLLPEEFRNGVAEIIKYAFITEEDQLYEKIVLKDIRSVVETCVCLKTKVVESGNRNILNFGHTIGHAIELLMNLKHGEAVAIGMVKEAIVGERLGVVTKEKRQKLIDGLRRNDLLLDVDIRSRLGEIIELMLLDKKNSGDNVVFAFDEKNSCVKINRKDLKGIFGGVIPFGDVV